MNMNAAAAVNGIAIPAIGRSIQINDAPARDFRLSRRYYPSNRAHELTVLGSQALSYVANIRNTSDSISDALQELTEGAAFSKIAMTFSRDTDHNDGSIRNPQNNAAYNRVADRYVGGAATSAADYSQTPDEVTVSFSSDVNYAVNTVDRLVSDFNRLYSEAERNSADPKAAELAARLNRIVDSNYHSLTDVGVVVSREGGELSVDYARISEAAESGLLEQFFVESYDDNFSFVNQLSSVANNVSANTSNYVSRDTQGDQHTRNFAYTNLGTLIHYTAFGVGMLFDISF